MIRMTKEQMDFYFANYMKLKDQCKQEPYDLHRSLVCGSLCKNLLERLLRQAGYDLDEQFNPDDFSFLEDRN
jgi:hypothetical protein